MVLASAVLLLVADLVAARSHESVLQTFGPKHRPGLREAASTLGLDYPPRRLTLVGLKQEKTLEVWAAAGAGWRRLRRYPVLAASGGPGPKLRQGDLQVPEGVYRLTAFNPNSSYHLSVRVDYPNADDRRVAVAEGRTNLGGDIFIHGKAVSIGCLAIGDAAIEELYVLLADVGLARTRMLLTPSAAPQAPNGAADWLVALYARLSAELHAVRGPRG
jgi:murein L,D-transpeptidase YafK